MNFEAKSAPPKERTISKNRVRFRSTKKKFNVSITAELLRPMINRNKLDPFHPTKNISAARTTATTLPSLPMLVDPTALKVS